MQAIQVRTRALSLAMPETVLAFAGAQRDWEPVRVQVVEAAQILDLAQAMLILEERQERQGWRGRRAF